MVDRELHRSGRAGWLRAAVLGLVQLELVPAA